MSLPNENLDNKSYAGLVNEALARIPVYAPGWTDFNAHDPGITFIEMFAWLTELQLYRLNRISFKNKQKFLKLMGINEIEVKKENLEEKIAYVRKDLLTPCRGVTSADYEYLLLNAPETGIPAIARAKVIPRYHPIQHQDVPGIVTVVVVPENPDLDAMQKTDILETVYQYLDQYRLLTTELFVVFPLYVTVSVEAEIAVKPRFIESEVKKDVRKALNTFLDEDKKNGGPDGSGWPFGRPVYRSEIFQVIDNINGVDYVQEDLALKKDNDEWIEDDIIIPRHYLVCPGDLFIYGIGEKEEDNG